jgi:hypothetical protein
MTVLPGTVSPAIAIDLEGFADRLAFPPGEGPPRLVVVVDTEEEFDWGAPFSRDSTGVVSAPEQDRAHEIFDPLGVRPTYVIDYCIAADPVASGYFRRLQDDGRCAVGAHLHPWVTPPHEEAVTTHNSYHGNLDPSLERRKLAELTRTIADGTGRRPEIFKAGRYGLGPYSFDAIAAEGYTIDCSVVPYTSFARDGGPVYHGWPSQPFWIDGEHRLLEVPLSCGFSGAAAGRGGRLQGLFDDALAKRLRLPGILARIGMIERAVLTPEGVTAEEQIRLMRALFAQGIRFFSLTYHSPSLGVGHTPYVRDAADRREFLSRLREVLHVFRDELGGEFVTMREIRDAALARP